MRVNRNLINGQPPIFGNRDQIALQKAAEAGVTNLKPVATIDLKTLDQCRESFWIKCEQCACFPIFAENRVCTHQMPGVYIDANGNIYELATEE